MTPLRSVKWLIALIATTMAFLEVMDMIIVTVSMRSMCGALSASTAQISWTMSAYMISAAIVTPLTGLFVSRYGRRRVLLYGILGFALFSGLCGLANSLQMMIVFRVLQGAAGAPLTPLAQSIMAEFFQAEERHKAMALFSIGIMTAPLFGPIIGGYINDDASWRFIFFINVPICLLIYHFAYRYVQDTPLTKTPIDGLGLVTMVLGIGLLQFLLSEGSNYDWFNSRIMILSAFLGMFSLTFFVVHSYGRSHRIINFAVFGDRNFIKALLLGVLFNAGFMAATPLISIQLEAVLGYPAAYVGYLLAPRGLASIVMMILMPGLMRHFKAPILIEMGFILYACGTDLLSQQSALVMNHIAIVCSTLLQGMATAFFFVPLSVVAYKTLPRDLISQASGVFNFTRAWGGSLGLSIFVLLQEYSLQNSWNHVHFQDAGPRAMGGLLQEIIRQTAMLSYANTYFLIALTFLVGFALAVGMLSTRIKNAI